MLKRWMCGAALSLGMLVMVGCSSHPTAEATAVLGVQPTTLISRTAGNAPALTEPGVVLVNDATALESLNCPQLAAIDVDFDTQSLVVFALGECPTGGFWAHIQSVSTLGDEVIVQSVANQPADDATATQAKTYPFEAAVVQKVQGTAVLRTESVQGQEHPSDEVVKDEPAVTSSDDAQADDATTKTVTDQVDAAKADADAPVK